MPIPYSSHRRLLALLLLSLLALPASAQIYKSTNKQGNPSFSDSRDAGSEEVTLPQTNTTPAVTPSPQAEPKAAATAPASITLSQPSDGQILPNGLTPTTLVASLGQPLENGQQIVFAVDGRQVSAGAQLQYRIAQLSRGPHRLSASLIDKNGNTLSTDSVGVTVYWPGN